VCHHSRAAMPAPGALWAGRTFIGIIDTYEVDAPGEAGSIVFEDESVCHVRVGDGVIVFNKSKKVRTPN